MRCLVVAAALIIGILSAPQAGRAQNADEVKKLQEKIELLEIKLDLLKRENDLLKRENELLKKQVGKKDETGQKGAAADAAGRPAASADGIDYFIDKVSRNGSKVTLAITATNSKADRKVTFFGLEAVDADGNVYKVPRLTDPRTPLLPLQVNIRAEVKTRFEIVIPSIPPKTSELSRVEVSVGRNNESIQFRNVRLSKN